MANILLISFSSKKTSILGQISLKPLKLTSQYWSQVMAQCWARQQAIMWNIVDPFFLTLHICYQTLMCQPYMKSLHWRGTMCLTLTFCSNIPRSDIKYIHQYAIGHCSSTIIMGNMFSTRHPLSLSHVLYKTFLWYFIALICWNLWFTDCWFSSIGAIMT